MFLVQNDKLVDFDHVSLCYSLKLVKHKKLECISDILSNFQKPPPSLVSEIYPF